MFSDLINNDTVKWWSGFYSYATTFNLTAALDPSSANYQLLLRDIDAIAVQLLRLQAANIPVLWRPLHEADGTWFWWGAYGPESCKTLYRLIFTRLTEYHKLRNLIWVWNSVSPAWYPGDDVVDIVGYDSYPPVGDHGPVSLQYQQLISLVKDKKMATLPEVGTIPDPDLLKAYKVDWSYFVTWNGEFIESDKYQDLAFKKKVYEDPTVLKLSDLGNWKGTATATSSSSAGVSSSSTKVVSSTTTTLVTSTKTKTSTLSSKTSSVKSTTSIKTTSKTTAKSTSATKTSTKMSTTKTAVPIPTQTKWGQCGGDSWTGAKVCESGSTCKAVSPPWYYQCL